METSAASTLEPTAGGMPLRAAFAQWIRYPQPWLLSGTAVFCAVMRLRVGPLTGEQALKELAVWAGLLAWWPFQEWLIHVLILHFRPRRVGRWTLDLHVAREHRIHHGDPNRVEKIFIPLRTLVVGIPVMLVAVPALLPWQTIAWSALAFYFARSTLYEWIHYLVHTPYRARSAWYKHLWRHHRLHHYKNEKFWYGVSVTVGDELLRTAPDHHAVPTSPTCRTLGAHV